MCCLEFGFKLVSGVEMVFDGPLAAARHKDHVAHTRRISLFHRVLNQRFVHYGQHFFGRGFGGRQKTSAQTRHREDGFANDVVAHGVSDVQDCISPSVEVVGEFCRAWL